MRDNNPMEFEYTSVLPFDVSRVYGYLTAPRAQVRVAPPFQKVNYIARHGSPQNQGTVEMWLKERFLPRLKWTLRFKKAEPSKDGEAAAIVTEQETGPFKVWTLEETLEPHEKQTRLVSKAYYDMPLGRVGRWLNAWEIKRNLEGVFNHRHQQMAMDLAMAQHYKSEPLHVAISGTGGMVGSQLAAVLQALGHKVYPLVRHEPDERQNEILWNPDAQELDREALEGMDAIIHLAGEPIVKRWTKTQKNYLLKNREQGTRLLTEAIALLREKPKVFMAASAIGYYGHRPAETLNESSPQGEGFPAEVTGTIEGVVKKLATAAPEVRCVSLRSGLILNRRGGALARMLPAFTMGVGGPLGNGEQVVSWISLQDAVAAIYHILMTPTMNGPVNLTAPKPVTNRHFSKALGRCLYRPAVCTMPTWAVKILFGEMGEELLLGSTYALPEKLQMSGFRFTFSDIQPALSWEVKGHLEPSS